jgi:hypothetical protein
VVVTGANWPAILLIAGTAVALLVAALLLVVAWLDRRSSGGLVANGSDGGIQSVLVAGGSDAGSARGDCGSHGGDAGCH